MLESQAAAEQKGDKVVAPEVSDVFSLLDQLTSAIDAVAGQVDAKVRAWGSAGRLRITQGGVISRSGQGFGFRVQKEANSAAASSGRMTKFAGWYAGHCPPVVHATRRDGPRPAVRRARLLFGRL